MFEWYVFAAHVGKIKSRIFQFQFSVQCARELIELEVCVNTRLKKKKNNLIYAPSMFDYHRKIYINLFVANKRFLTDRRPGSNCETIYSELFRIEIEKWILKKNDLHSGERTGCSARSNNEKQIFRKWQRKCVNSNLIWLSIFMRVSHPWAHSLIRPCHSICNALAGRTTTKHAIVFEIHVARSVSCVVKLWFLLQQKFLFNRNRTM